ncbi:MAG: DUF4255 domain-containing protein [Pseudomonadota bacterium]
MSDALALATVSSALRRRVLSAAVTAVPDAVVRLGTPTAKLAEDNDAMVNIHLYRVEPNGSHANTHFPTRSGKGEALGPARLALDLHYIFSFYGDAEDLVPERIMAQVMLALEKVPLLTHDTITAAIADNPELTESDLADALSQVHISRELMSIDDFSKVWSIFYQVPYALSLAYRMSHVAIETEETAKIAMPVTRTGLLVTPLSKLRLDGVSGASRKSAPITWNAEIAIAGSGLSADGSAFVIDGLDFDITGASISDERLIVALEAARLGGQELAVGAHAMRVLAPLPPGSAPHLRTGSDSVMFALVPTITISAVSATGGGATRNGVVDIAVEPSVLEEQSAALLLDSRDAANPLQVRLTADIASVVFPTAALSFPFADLPPGDYLARLDIDGFVSPVAVVEDPASPNRGEIAGPLVSVA